MSEVLTEAAQAHERAATRYAAELLDKLGVPATYDDAITLVAVAYLEGEIAQLKVARDSVRGDEARVEYRDFLRSLPEARGVRDDA